MLIGEAIGSIATVLAVIGVVLNNHRRRECFYVWLVSNAITLGLHVWLGAYSLATRDAIFWLLAIYGLIAWKRPQRAKERCCYEWQDGDLKMRSYNPAHAAAATAKGKLVELVRN